MKRMMRLGSLLVAVLMAGGMLVGCTQKATVDTLPQFEREIKEGEEIAVITVKDYGEIRVRFFAEEAPKAVENFITLAKEGYYDELTFHRVMKNFMIQGGDPKGDGTGGESCWGEDFENELAENLCHFRGALCMANTGKEKSNSSQFFIVQNHTAYTDEILDELEDRMKEAAAENGINYVYMADKVREKYKEVGGYPGLDGGYTVFGQVYEGMDVVDEIAACKVKTVYDANGNGEDSKPVEQVMIQKVEILPYKK